MSVNVYVLYAICMYCELRIDLMVSRKRRRPVITLKTRYRPLSLCHCSLLSANLL